MLSSSFPTLNGCVEVDNVCLQLGVRTFIDKYLQTAFIVYLRTSTCRRQMYLVLQIAMHCQFGERENGSLEPTAGI